MNIKDLNNRIKSGKKRNEVILVEGDGHRAVVYAGNTLPFTMYNYYVDGNLALITEYSNNNKLRNVQCLNTSNTPEELAILIGKAKSSIYEVSDEDIYCEYDETMKKIEFSISVVPIENILEYIDLDFFIENEIEDIKESLNLIDLSDYSDLSEEELENLSDEEFEDDCNKATVKYVNEQLDRFKIFKSMPDTYKYIENQIMSNFCEC